MLPLRASSVTIRRRSDVDKALGEDTNTHTQIARTNHDDTDLFCAAVRQVRRRELRPVEAEDEVSTHGKEPLAIC